MRERSISGDAGVAVRIFRLALVALGLDHRIENLGVDGGHGGRVQRTHQRRKASEDRPHSHHGKADRPSKRSLEGQQTLDPKSRLIKTDTLASLNIGETDMHHSRLCAVLVDCKVADLDEAAHFWAEALGRPVDCSHPMSRGNYRMLETPPDEPIVEVQRVRA